MSFDKFLDRRQVKKKIDDSLGDQLPKIQDIDTSVKEEVAKQTELSNLVKDTVSTAEELTNLIQGSIDNIVLENQGYPAFDAYAFLLKEIYTGGSAESRPISFFSVKDLERDVYLNINNPKASFLKDLYRKLTSVQNTLRVLRNVWLKIVSANNLYEKIHNSKKARLAILKTQQELRDTAFYVSKILGLSNPVLSEDFIQGLAYKIQNISSEDLSLAKKSDVDVIFGILDYTIRDFSLDSLNHFEYFNEVLDRDFGNSVLENYNYKYDTSCKYAHLLGVSERLNDFFQDFGQLSPNPEQLLELKRQSEYSVFRAATAIESDLINKERAEVIRIQELLYENIKQTALTKAYSFIINQALRNINSGSITSLQDFSKLPEDLIRNLKGAISDFKNLKKYPLVPKIIVDFNKAQVILKEVKSIIAGVSTL